MRSDRLSVISGKVLLVFLRGWSLLPGLASREVGLPLKVLVGRRTGEDREPGMGNDQQTD